MSHRPPNSKQQVGKPAIFPASSLQYSSEISFKNKFRTLAKAIIRKLEDYKLQKSRGPGFDNSRLVEFMAKKIESRKGEYYDFLREEDDFLVRILVGFLYEELEETLKRSKRKQYENMDKIKQLRKTLHDYEKLFLSPSVLPQPQPPPADPKSNKRLTTFLSKIVEINELFRVIRSRFWRILNEDIEFEKLRFASETERTRFVGEIEVLEGKIVKVLANNEDLLHGFNVFEASDEEHSFDEGNLTGKSINVLEVKPLSTSGPVRSSPLRNIFNSSPNLLQGSPPRRFASPETLETENKMLRAKIEELRRDFSEISSNVLRTMNERDIHSKQLLSENEQLLRRGNLNTIDFQSIEQKYQNKLLELKREAGTAQERVLKLIEEKQGLIKEIRDLKLGNEDLGVRVRSLCLQMEHLTHALGEKDKEVSRVWGENRLLGEKLLSFEKERLTIKNHERNIDSLTRENQELSKQVEKLSKEVIEAKAAEGKAVQQKSEDADKARRCENLNEMSEIQLLSCLILTFSRYKNNEIEEKNRIVIEKYLRESQKDYLAKTEAALSGYREKCGKYLESLREKISSSLLLFQDLKWLLGILEENKAALESVDAKNFAIIHASLREDHLKKSHSLSKKIPEWNSSHVALKEELELIVKEIEVLENPIKGPSEKESSRSQALQTALENENKELKRSLSQLNSEIRRIDSERERTQEELRRLRKEKEEGNCGGLLYSNESFGGGEEKHAEKEKNLELTVMLQMQAIAIENLLKSLE